MNSTITTVISSLAFLAVLIYVFKQFMILYRRQIEHREGESTIQEFGNKRYGQKFIAKAFWAMLIFLILILLLIFVNVRMQ